MFRKNRNIATTLSLLLAALAISACGNAEAIVPATVTTEASVPANSSVVNENSAQIWLEAPTGTYQKGWANLLEQDGNLIVSIEVEPPEAVAQPAHVHRGECSMLGVIDYRLENVIGGRSETVLEDVQIEDLATGDLAINLHLSFADFSTFTACGEIPTLETE